ncbi:hypothetical protein [Secundilactobacillus kimchicus]|uniref:hypothetical protein n=1 Tax=Secundilactobacillus kimchicus TaxID=528209 RepID=UPI0006D00AB7|nr:hypothetical protein [Secundilactobacillus kimchicus]
MGVLIKARLNLFNGDADVAAFDDIDMTPYGELIGNPNKAGVIYKVKKDAPAPFTKVAGAQSQAIAAYPVQNEHLLPIEVRFLKRMQPKSFSG